MNSYTCWAVKWLSLHLFCSETTVIHSILVDSSLSLSPYVDNYIHKFITRIWQYLKSLTILQLAQPPITFRHKRKVHWKIVGKILMLSNNPLVTSSKSNLSKFRPLDWEKAKNNQFINWNKRIWYKVSHCLRGVQIYIICKFVNRISSQYHHEVFVPY